MDNDDEAAGWAIRLDSGALDVEAQAALDVWLAEDQRRRGALLRAEAALAYLDRGRALAHPGDTVDAQPRHFLRRRGFLAGAAGAGIAASGVAALLLSRPSTVELRTVVGEVRRVPLADGSVASINTDSRIAVTMRDQRRDVRIETGEVWFEVAHDKTRPFVVEAGGVRVQAVGTAFAVRRHDRGADILVTEGAVDVWVVGREERRTRIAAGSKSFVAETMPTIAVAPVEDGERALAWRSGELALNGESLAYAVAELNRYNIRKLRVDDPALEREALVGYFRTDQPEAFGRTVASMIDAKVSIEGETIRIYR